MDIVYLLDENSCFAGNVLKNYADENNLEYTEIPVPQPWIGNNPQLINGTVWQENNSLNNQ